MRTPPDPGAPGREGSIERRDFLRGAALAGTGLALGCRTDAGRAERGAVDRPSPTGSDAASAPPLLIHRASVFDTRTGAMRPDTSVLVRDGRIEAVAAAAELGPGSDAAEGAPASSTRTYTSATSSTSRT